MPHCYRPNSDDPEWDYKQAKKGETNRHSPIETRSSKLVGGERKEQQNHDPQEQNEITFPCDLCDYKATRKYNLKRHIDSVHGDM